MNIRQRASTPFVPSAQHIDFDLAGRRHPGLLAKVIRYDPALAIYYDSAVARWGIARITPSGYRFIALWQTDEGQYLPLDERLIHVLASWDLRPNWKQGPKNADQESDLRDQADLDRAAKAEKDFDDDISHATRSNKRQLVRALERAL